MPRNHPILLRYEITDGEGYLKELMAIHGSGMMMCLTGNSTQSDDGLPHSFLLGVMVVDVLTIFVGEMLRSSGLTNSPKLTGAALKRLVKACLRQRMSLVSRSFQGPSTFYNEYHPSWSWLMFMADDIQIDIHI